MKIIGIDNGTSGSFAMLTYGHAPSFGPMPTKMSLLGKKERRITRIDVDILRHNLKWMPVFNDGNCKAYVERPFTGRFLNAVLPAQRAFEAVLIALEQENVPYEVIDSKVWQKPLLGDVKGSANLKLASQNLGCGLYPELAPIIKAHGDADGLLIAHYFAKMGST